MKIGVLATEQRLQAWKQTLKPDTSFSVLQDSKSSSEYDVFFDLDFDSHPERLREYSRNGHSVLFLSAVNIQLENAFSMAGLHYGSQKILGINAIPGFLERTTLEYCNPFGISDISAFNSFTWASHTSVLSRVGMVSPRIVFMIINEAYYTLQEGTASKADIDTAMKLGTNYPLGPFEWTKAAGIANVYHTLSAVYEDTRDERYKICPLLKTEYLQSLINP